MKYFIYHITNRRQTNNIGEMPRKWAVSQKNAVKETRAHCRSQTRARLDTDRCTRVWCLSTLRRVERAATRLTYRASGSRSSVM